MIIPVPLHHARGLDQQFIVLAYTGFHTIQWNTNTARFIIFGHIDTDYRAGFGQALTLQDRDAEADKGLRNRKRQRGATTDGHAQSPAQFCSDLFSNQFP
jgi:hypothetical protein